MSLKSRRETFGTPRALLGAYSKLRIEERERRTFRIPKEITMKNHMRSFVISIGLSAVLGSSAIVAQESARAIANVPFAFHVKDTNLPAGKYIVKAVNGAGVIQIADANTGHSMMLLTQGNNSSKSDSPRLTFQRYGNDYFLSQVWLPGKTGYALRPSSREKELAKQPGLMATATVRIQGE
jgi:hypothetical protein